MSIHGVYVCLGHTNMSIHTPRHRKTYAALDIFECKYKFDNVLQLHLFWQEIF